MINNKSIAVVVPSYNESSQIGVVIETMPDFVDRIIIVNDCSKDGMAKIVEGYIQKKSIISQTLSLQTPQKRSLN